MNSFDFAMQITNYNSCNYLTFIIAFLSCQFHLKYNRTNIILRSRTLKSIQNVILVLRLVRYVAISSTEYKPDHFFPILRESLEREQKADYL